MAAIAEESPAKRRKISKDSFLDIIEDPHTPLKIKEKASVMPIEVCFEQSVVKEISLSNFVKIELSPVSTPADFVDFSCRRELKNEKQT